MFKLVKRERASYYLLLVVISFALSVLGTRLFLYLSGYPQLGNDTLHIAHVLWGGLLLGLGALLVLVFSNARLYVVASICIGAGFGLFIDEVGKFITQSNDYFYQPAAAIIYVFFLLAVLFYIYLSRAKEKTDREMFYHVFDDCKEILEGDLDPFEKARILQKLTHIIQTSKNEELREFAQAMRNNVAVFDSLVQYKQPRLQKLWFGFWDWIKQRKHLQQAVFYVLLGLLVIRGVGAIFDLIVGGIYFLGGENIRLLVPIELVDDSLIKNSFDVPLFLFKITVDGLVGIAIVFGIFFRIVKNKWNFTPLTIAILFSLCTSDIVGFYFNQFRQAIDILIDVGIVAVISFIEHIWSDEVHHA